MPLITEELFIEDATLSLSTISDVMSRGDFVGMRQFVKAAEIKRIEAIYKDLSGAERDWLRVERSDMLLVEVLPEPCLFDKIRQRIKIPVLFRGLHERELKMCNFGNTCFVAFYMFDFSLTHAEEFKVSALSHRTLFGSGKYIRCINSCKCEQWRGYT